MFKKKPVEARKSCIVESHPDGQNIIWVNAFYEVPFGPRWPITFSNVLRKKIGKTSTGTVVSISDSPEYMLCVCG